MGNKSSSKYGNIYLKTDKPIYVAGEVITGQVYLNIIEPNYPTNSVFLKLKGLEYVTWNETQGAGDQRRTYHYFGTNILFSYRILLYKFINSMTLPVGQYCFPFQYQTQPNIPGSFDNGYKPRISNQNGQSNPYSYGGVTAYTQYIIEAEVIPQNSTFVSALKFDQELIINEPQKQQSTQVQGEQAIEVKTCCCCSKGTTKLKAMFDKNHFYPLDKAQIIIAVDNSQSKQSVQKIQLKLVNYLTVKTNCGRARTFTNTVHEEDLNGLGPGETQPQILANFTLSNDGKQIKASTNGIMINNIYTLMVNLNMGCCQNDVKVEIPITILCPAQPSYQVVPQQPPNWNPQQMDCRQIVPTDQDRYYGKKENACRQNNNQNMMMNNYNQTNMNNQSNMMLNNNNYNNQQNMNNQPNQMNNNYNQPNQMNNNQPNQMNNNYNQPNQMNNNFNQPNQMNNNQPYMMNNNQQNMNNNQPY